MDAEVRWWMLKDTAELERMDKIEGLRVTNAQKYTPEEIAKNSQDYNVVLFDGVSTEQTYGGLFFMYSKKVRRVIDIVELDGLSEARMEAHLSGASRHDIETSLPDPD